VINSKLLAKVLKQSPTPLLIVIGTDFDMSEQVNEPCKLYWRYDDGKAKGANNQEEAVSAD
jgi:hypothetical protein